MAITITKVEIKQELESYVKGKKCKEVKEKSNRKTQFLFII